MASNEKRDESILDKLRSELVEADKLVSAYEEGIQQYRDKAAKLEARIQEFEDREKRSKNNERIATEKYEKAKKFQADKYKELINDLFDDPKRNLEETLTKQSKKSFILTVSTAIVSIILSIFITSYYSKIKSNQIVDTTVKESKVIRGGELNKLLSRTISVNEEERRGSVRELFTNLKNCDQRQILYYYLPQLDSMISLKNYNGVYHAATILGRLNDDTLNPHKMEIESIYNSIKDSDTWIKTSEKFKIILSKLN